MKIEKIFAVVLMNKNRQFYDDLVQFLNFVPFKENDPFSRTVSAPTTTQSTQSLPTTESRAPQQKSQSESRAPLSTQTPEPRAPQITPTALKPQNLKVRYSIAFMLESAMKTSAQIFNQVNNKERRIRGR